MWSLALESTSKWNISQLMLGWFGFNQKHYQDELYDLSLWYWEILILLTLILLSNFFFMYFIAVLPCLWCQQCKVYILHDGLWCSEFLWLLRLHFVFLGDLVSHVKVKWYSEISISHARSLMFGSGCRVQQTWIVGVCDTSHSRGHHHVYIMGK